METPPSQPDRVAEREPSDDRSRGWIRRRPHVAFLLIGLLATAVYSAPGTSVLLNTIIVVALHAAAAAAILLELRRRPSAPRWPWAALAGWCLLWGLGWLVWQLHILASGTAPPYDSIAFPLYLTGTPLLLATLLYAAVRGERRSAVLLDVAIIASALATTMWVALVHRYYDAATGQAAFVVQSANALADVVTVSIVLRLALPSRGLSVPTYLVAGGALALSASNIWWNWLTAFASYETGSWGDTGYLLAPVAFATAALHPQMAELGRTRDQRSSSKADTRTVVLLLVGSSLVIPVLLKLAALGLVELHLGSVAVGAGVLGVLSVLRLVVLISEEQTLRADLATHLERVREAESQLRAIIDHAPVGIFLCRPDGTILHANPAREQLLGYPAGELVGRNMVEFVHWADRERVRELFAQLAAGSVTHGRLEKRDVTSTGGIAWVQATFSTTHDDRGKPELVIAMAEDIGRRRGLELEREATLRREREQVERLRELDRLKDDFVATISHELRTPLTSVQGYIELLRDPTTGALNETQDRFLAVVERNTQRLLRLVGDLLFVAGVEAGTMSLELSTFDLAELVTECATSAHPATEAHGLELHVEAHPVYVEGDRSRLAQLLDNLLANAYKFTPEGGRVSAIVERSGDHAIVTVSDTGIGIPETEQPLLFTKFYRAEGSSRNALPGTGLGLSIVKAIVDAHGGTVSVSSTEGEGASFRVELPAVEVDPAAAPTATRGRDEQPA